MFLKPFPSLPSALIAVEHFGNKKKKSTVSWEIVLGMENAM